VLICNCGVTWNAEIRNETPVKYVFDTCRSNIGQSTAVPSITKVDPVSLSHRTPEGDFV